MQVKDNMEMIKIVLSYGSHCKVKLKYVHRSQGSFDTEENIRQ